MTESLEIPPSGRDRTILYVVVSVVVVVAVVVGLLFFRAGAHNRQADQKADQLVAALQKAGVRAPQKETIVRLLGSDGGPVCANPNKPLTKAFLVSQLANGAAGPGMRPILADNEALKGELLAVHTYCPDQLPGLEKLASQLQLNQNVAE